MRMLLRLSAGLLGWAAAFCLIYALHGVGCAGGWEARVIAGIGLQRWVLIGAWGASLAATFVIARWLSRHSNEPLDRAAAATGWIGFAATAITFLPVVIVPACL